MQMAGAAAVGVMFRLALVGVWRVVGVSNNRRVAGAFSGGLGGGFTGDRTKQHHRREKGREPKSAGRCKLPNGHCANI